MNLHQRILTEIKKTVRGIEPRSEIILFGSRARGDQREDSDWDLLILTPSQAGLKEEQIFRHRLFELELRFGVAISTLVKSREEWDGRFSVTPLYENISREGVLI